MIYYLVDILGCGAVALSSIEQTVLQVLLPYLSLSMEQTVVELYTKLI